MTNTAGWMFLCAKMASAATAALGLAGYGLHALRLDGSRLMVPFWEAPSVAPQGGIAGLLHATALMFVAFTGYGRVATLGEEVREPGRTLPRAIVLTLVISALLYMGVGLVAIGAVGASALYTATQGRAAPLETVARQFGVPGGHALVAAGAMTAMLAVLLNLLLGLSRVLLAMARRGDMPPALARLNPAATTPTAAVLVVGALIAGLTLIGNVRVTWSFSAFTVLIYYALTNLAALQLPPSQRLYPRWLAYAGLAACGLLAFWVETPIWLTGLALIAVGLVWRFAAQRLTGP